MKIAIIGGGWVGCHLALKLKEKHDITLFEKNAKLFTETSYKNQNRLHFGFHYARNHKTRQMCKDTFNKFIADYWFLTKEITNNYYCIPNIKSVVDFETYKKIFKSFENNNVGNLFNDVEGCINTKERYIDFNAAQTFFNKQLSEIIVHEDISKNKLITLSKKFDLVINATNNHIKNTKVDSFYESTLTLLYTKIKPTNFDALTLVDGEFFSIYPYDENRFTVTDVKLTPLKKFKSIKHLIKYNSDINEVLINKRKSLIEKNIVHYFPEFLNQFQYDNYFISTKSKIVSTSDSRYPIMEKDGNIINCFTGKIQGIYIIEDYINKFI